LCTNFSQFEEKFEEINAAEPPTSLALASSSGSTEQQVTEMVPAECSGNGLDPQALLSSQEYSDLNVSQELAGGMMKIVPSDADVSMSYSHCVGFLPAFILTLA
jgi:transcription factor E2F3